MAKVKRITAHDDKELDEAITEAVSHCHTVAGLDFFKILHGVDAYMERRKRRNERWQDANYVEQELDPWGNS